MWFSLFTDCISYLIFYFLTFLTVKYTQIYWSENVIREIWKEVIDA